MIIRAARSTEIDTLAALGALAWEQAFDSAGEDTNQFSRNAKATYHHFCSSFWPIILVLEIDGEVLAWGAFENSDEQLTDIWVLPNFQRAGIGSALLKGLEEQAALRGAEKVELETHAKNSQAVSFFKKNGFAVSGLKSAYSPVLDKSVDTLEMRKMIIVS